MRDLLTEIVVAAEGVAPNAACGLTLVRGGQPLLITSSDQRAARLEQVQHKHGGPLTWSVEHRQAISVPDVSKEARWPVYSERAIAEDVRSSFTIPVAVAVELTVVLSIYAPCTGAFGPVEQRDACRYAEEAERSVALAVRLSASERTAWQLESALESRSLISQAVGVIMAENRCDADRAFGILRTASQNRNLKLRDVASMVIAGVDHAPTP